MAGDRTGWVAWAGAATAGLILIGVLVAPDPVRSQDAQAAPRPRTEVGAAAVLAAWDAQRAAAWASGDVRRLRKLYVADSAAGKRDAARLREWTNRGAVVTGMRTQLLEVRTTDESARRLDLVVTDRLVGAEARIRGDRIRLPAQTPQTYQVRLVRRGGRWLVARVSEPS